MAAALLTILADEMWTEAKDSNNDKRLGKERSKRVTKIKEGERLDTEKIARVRNSNYAETDEHRYRWMNDNNSTQIKTKDNAGKKSQICFDNIFEDCKGILFGKL